MLALSECKFAVMAKSDYQRVLANVDRRRTEAIKDFLRQIPLFGALPRAAFKTLHLSVTRVVYQRGQVVCREGDDCEHLFIINKGEFEASKVIEDKPMLVNNSHRQVQMRGVAVRSHALN